MLHSVRQIDLNIIITLRERFLYIIVREIDLYLIVKKID